MSIPCVGQVAPGVERGECVLAEQCPARHRVEVDRRPFRNIVPAEEQMTVIAQPRVALGKGGFELLLAIQAPAVHTVTDDEIEMPGRKMTVQVFEGRDYMLFGAEAGGVRVGLDGPEVLVREKLLLVMRGVAAAAHEQHAPDRRIAGVFRKDVAFHDDAVRGVEWHRQSEPLPQNARGEAVFREESAQQIPLRARRAADGIQVDTVLDLAPGIFSSRHQLSSSVSGL